MTNKDNDLDEFRPERWIIKADTDGTEQTESASESEDSSEFEGYTGQDTQSQLFLPVRDSYLAIFLGSKVLSGKTVGSS